MKTCSGVDNGVRGLSACSVISALFDHSHLTRLSPSVPSVANAPRMIQKLQEALWHGKFGKIVRWTEKPDRGGAGKGEGAAGNNIRNNREEAYLCWADNF